MWKGSAIALSYKLSKEAEVEMVIITRGQEFYYTDRQYLHQYCISN